MTHLLYIKSFHLVQSLTHKNTTSKFKDNLAQVNAGRPFAVLAGWQVTLLYTAKTHRPGAFSPRLPAFLPEREHSLQRTTQWPLDERYRLCHVIHARDDLSVEARGRDVNREQVKCKQQQKFILKIYIMYYQISYVLFLDINIKPSFIF